MITRADVADLRAGDVVEITHADWPEGTVVRGPLWLFDGETLQVGRIVVRHWDGRHPFDTGLTLTVISRAPRPLYVNSGRSKPYPGDIVRDADDAEHNWTWHRTSSDTWLTARGALAGATPARLRLLVDGTTGQVVR